jgi:hypothetical protein
MRFESELPASTGRFLFNKGALPIAGETHLTWGLAHAFPVRKRRVPRPSRVLSERAGLLEASPSARPADFMFQAGSGPFM